MQLSLHSRGHDHSKSNDEEQEHHAKKIVNGLVGTLEFLPHKHTPNGRDHRSALSEGIGYGSSCLTGGYIAEGGTKAPDASTKHSHEVSLGIAFEIFTHLDRRTLEWPFHKYRAENEVADKNSEAEHDDGGVRTDLAWLHIREILEVHRLHHE